MPSVRPTSSRARRSLVAVALAAVVGGCAPPTAEREAVGTRPLQQEVAPRNTVFEIAPAAPAPGGGETATDAGGDTATDGSGDGATDEAAAGLSPLRGLVRVYDRGETHRLILANATSLKGQNELRAHLRPEPPSLFSIFEVGRMKTTVPRIRPDSDWLDETLDARFPAPLERSDVNEARNAYGNFQYVILGYADRQKCIFGWQQLRDRRDAVDLPGSLQEVFLQMRFCAVDRSDRALLADFQRVRLDFLPTYEPGETRARPAGRWGGGRDRPMQPFRDLTPEEDPYNPYRRY